MELPALRLDPDVKEYLTRSLSESKQAPEQDIEGLLAVLGCPPAFTTLRINDRVANKDIIVDKITDALNTQYKEKGWLPPQVLTHPDIPDVVIVPHKKGEVSPARDEVIVDVSCGMSVLRGADVFAQGILAAPPGMTVNHQVAVYADLDFGCRRGLTKPYAGRKVFVGNGISKVSRARVFCGDSRGLSGVGIQMTEPLLKAPSLDRFLPDLVFPQNLPSIVCGHVLDPKPGETILDMCAAPGGKTSHIATLMSDQGRLVALDKSKNKIHKIQENCERWGLTCVQAYHFDGTKSVEQNSDVEGSPPFPPGTFDRVLLDAPCSALGQRPSLHNRMKISEATSYPPLQKKLFSQAVESLKPGGTLVYSTCSIPMDENEKMVSWALKHHPNINLVTQTPHLGGQGWPCDGLTAAQTSLLQRFNPQSLIRDQKSVNLSVNDTDLISECNRDTIGFFIAKFIKTDSR